MNYNQHGAKPPFLFKSGIKSAYLNFQENSTENINPNRKGGEPCLNESSLH